MNAANGEGDRTTPSDGTTSAAAPGVSIVTATVGRADALHAKADALLAQTLPADRWEWIVAFDGPQPECEDRLRSVMEGRVAFRSVTIAKAGPGPARDAAAALARFSVLYLSDDDCIPAPDVLQRHLEAQRRSAVYLGTVVFVEGDRDDVVVPPGRPGWWRLGGANASLPTAAFRSVGGFGALTKGYGGEDLWLGRRLARNGVPFRALGSARVRHLGPDPRRSGDGVRAYRAGINAVRIAQRDPAVTWRLGVHPWLLRAKALALALPGLAADPAVRRYEREYARGAREAWRTTPTTSPANDAHEEDRR